MEYPQSNPQSNKDQSDYALAGMVKANLEQYFQDLNGTKATAVYPMVIAEVERSLFSVVMDQAKGNQSKAAKILGLSRSTLRKKLKIYGLTKH